MKHTRSLVVTEIIALLSAVYFPIHVASEDCTEGQPISLFNLGTGYFPYAYSNSANSYVEVDSVTQLQSGSYPHRASWRIVNNPDGSISLRNVELVELCLRNYGVDYRLTQDRCNYLDISFQFDIHFHKSGSIQLRFRNTDRCMYCNNKGIYNGQCQDDNHHYLWAVIPPLALDIESYSADEYDN